MRSVFQHHPQAEEKLRDLECLGYVDSGWQAAKLTGLGAGACSDMLRVKAC